MNAFMTPKRSTLAGTHILTEVLNSIHPKFLFTHGYPCMRSSPALHYSYLSPLNSVVPMHALSSHLLKLRECYLRFASVIH
jgi:hypothetical protein